MNLKLVKKVEEAKDTKSFIFDKPEGFGFEAGQYIYLTLPKLNYPDARGDTRHFTISSSPTEDFIQVTTRIRQESGYKKTLDELPLGSLIESRGPMGSFVFNYTLYAKRYSLFLAGGIGITPFRSMIKYTIDKNLNIPMYLIYSNSDSDFVFKKELDTWQKENSFLKIEYFDSSKFGHLDKLKISKLLDSEAERVNWNLVIDHCMFWSVGPNIFVNSMEEILEKMNIPEENIKTEKFTGY